MPGGHFYTKLFFRIKQHKSYIYREIGNFFELPSKMNIFEVIDIENFIHEMNKLLSE